MQTRIYFLDNLRTFMIFLVVIVHSGLVYESALESIWIVVDPVKNNSIGLIRMYLDLIVMATIFFVSGYFIPISIKKRNTWDFISNKFKRLIIPWIIAVFTLIPAYKIIFLYSRGLPQEEWYSYFHFFQRVGGNPGFFADNPVQNWLWFLPVLFIFQLIYWGLSKVNWSFNISLKSAILLTFLLGVGYGISISSMGLQGWYHSFFLHFQNERLIVYFLFFLLGSSAYHHKAFNSFQENKKLFILANVVLTVVLGLFTVVALNLFFNLIETGRNHFFISEFVDKIFFYMLSMLSMLSFLYVLIYTFNSKLNFANKWMKQLNKSSYSVYIIHMIVLGIIAVLMVNFTLPSFLKFLILTLLTFAISNLLVYGYQQLFKKSILLKSVSLIMFVLSFFLITTPADNDISTLISNKIETDIPSTQAPTIGIHEAVIKGDVESLKQHINAGTDLNQREPSGGSSPLITAATFGKTELAVTLLENGADVNFVNNEGSTALHTAAFFCYPDFVQVLLKSNADMSIRNKYGSTALESISGPFEEVESIYDYFIQAFTPLGLDIDKEYIKNTRPQIAEILSEN